MGFQYKWFLLILTITMSGILYSLHKMDTYQFIQNNFLEIIQKKIKADPNLSKQVMDPGIIFVETTDKVEPTQLVVCSVESAARLNPDKHVYYFMKGFSGKLSQYPLPNYTGIPLLSATSNVVLLPLHLTGLFENTPLYEWHQKVNPDLETYWIHVLADGCRLALLWKYGGTYLDTDVISMKPLPFGNFTVLQKDSYFSNGVLGFHLKYHQFLLDSMKDFVANYIGDIWGHQDPTLITRVMKRWCKLNNNDQLTANECNGISFWIPRRFYPIPHPSWEHYYDPWKKEDIESIFSDTYGANVWNNMDSDKKKK
ncbi:alpha-1,4-N-acetylglucosaminyltransferase-like [Mustelus asterias]